MTSRDVVLQRIRSGLSHAAAAGFGGLTAPKPPEVWPRGNSSPAVLAERFAAELKIVQGETIRCATMDDARRQLVQLMDSAKWPNIGSVDRPLSREVTAALPAKRVAWAQPHWQPRQMSELPAGLVVADYLLADTGTAVIACPTAQDRLMCYLPPACVVVARVDQLAEHLPAAWADIAKRCADPNLTGEFVLVTGPSRTADIEKILILGVHGPKRLVVLVIG